MPDVPGTIKRKACLRCGGDLRAEQVEYGKIEFVCFCGGRYTPEQLEKETKEKAEKVKDAVVRDYLQGDKAIVIQMEYSISPSEMYRILHARQVKLRKAVEKPEPEMIFPQLPAGSGFRVSRYSTRTSYRTRSV